MSQPAAGWYPPDQSQPWILRYWDGQAWTEHVHDQRAAAQQDAPAEATTSPAPTPARNMPVLADEFVRTPDVKEKQLHKIVDGTATYLDPFEQVHGVFRLSSMRPPLDALVVTDRQLLAFMTADLSGKAPRVAKSFDEIGEVTFRSKFTGTAFAVVDGDGRSTDLGALLGSPRDLTALLPRRVVVSGAAPRTPDKDETATDQPAESSLDQRDRGWYDGISLVGRTPGRKPHEALLAHCGPGEKPWLVVNPGGSEGALAAFEDRLLIIKVGGMTGWMSGSMGGGRITTFPYAEITGIEYNAGMMTGVLEILTASYQGTANKDFWRGTNRGRNADSNDPWTLSNCLPLYKNLYNQALPHLNELRGKIANSKQPVVHVQGSSAAAAPTDIAAQLRELAALKAEGILSEAEFADAKAAIIRGQGHGP